MRKDVRMGFAVGGVLLAVLVVAILVFHRGKNSDKAVAFDAGGKPAGTTGADINAPDPGSHADTAGPTDVGPGTAATPAAAANTPASSTGQKTSPDDSAQKGGAQWDALFASTAADPIKAQLTSDPASKPKNKSKKHRSDGASSETADNRGSAPASTVANAPLDSGMVVDPPLSTRLGLSDRSTAAAPKESGRTHVVAQGETFVSIARAVYGDGRYYQVVDANPTVTPEKLKPGMTISLPPDSQVKDSHKASKSAPVASSSKASDGKTYTVQNGDSLYKIAKKLYGNGEKSEDLYQANKQTIGPDSTRLKIGMVLTLPEAPTAR